MSLRIFLAALKTSTTLGDLHQRSSRITTLADGQNRRVILSGSSGLSNLPVCIGLAGDTSVTPHHW